MSSPNYTMNCSQVRVSQVLIFALLSALMVLAWSSLSIAQTQSMRNEISSAKRLPVLPGDRCIVCGQELNDSDLVLRLRGRRVPVKREALEELEANPEKYFARLQPKGALFNESSNLPKPSWTWLLVGVVGLSIVVLVFGAGPYLKLRPILSSIPAGLTRPPSTTEPMQCVKCGKQNHPSAVSCLGCGAELSPLMRSEVS